MIVVQDPQRMLESESLSLQCRHHLTPGGT
jgi:hypothetical protein